MPDRPTDHLGCDANATGVMYTPYMCTTVFYMLFSMARAQSMDTKLVYYILFKSRGRRFSCPVGGGTVPPSRFDRDARR